MCRDGYKATCEKQGCEQITRCRDTMGFCYDHDPYDMGDYYTDTLADEPPLNAKKWRPIKALLRR